MANTPFTGPCIGIVLVLVLSLVELVQSCIMNHPFVSSTVRGHDDGLDKRWYEIIPGSGSGIQDVPGQNNNGKQWANGNIPVCLPPSYAADEQEDLLQGIQAGFNLWIAAGLSPDVMNLDMSGSTCVGITSTEWSTQRGHCLHALFIVFLG